MLYFFLVLKFFFTFLIQGIFLYSILQATHKFSLNLTPNQLAMCFMFNHIIQLKELKKNGLDQRKYLRKGFHKFA